MYRKRDGISVFYKTTYSGENPIRRIKLFLQDIKFCYQRIRYGWCDKDTWGMDNWFLTIIPPMLQHLRDNGHGYPGYMTESSEWEHILETMIHLFSEADEDLCSKKNDYEISSKRFINKEIELAKYRDECKNKAFEMFSKYFWSLWD